MRSLPWDCDWVTMSRVTFGDQMLRMKWRKRRNCVTVSQVRWSIKCTRPWAAASQAFKEIILLHFSQPFTSFCIAAPLQTPADAGQSQLTRNRRRRIVGRHMMVSLGVEEPRHEHEGLFVSALAILTSDCHTGEGESVGGEEVGRKLEPGCLASPLSPLDPLYSA